jgi:hypothetical protein
MKGIGILNATGPRNLDSVAVLCHLLLLKTAERVDDTKFAFLHQPSSFLFEVRTSP